MLIKTKQGFYVLKKWATISGLVHGFSSVEWGNMSSVYGQPEMVDANRIRFAQALGANPAKIVSVRQKHGQKILIAEGNGEFAQEEKITADGLLTRKREKPLLIKTADCLPILLFDPSKKVIGLLHAGRQGIILGIHQQGLTKMKKKWGCQPKNLLVGLGPVICSACYHAKIDLMGLVLADLREAGVAGKNIEIAEVCTFENPDFYSHQRSQKRGEPEARFATILGLT